MKALLYKQFRLLAHPMTYIFCLFGAMLLIPSYPYTVAYFYVTLGLFFTFQNGREQRDCDFSALLPVRKRDTVRAAILFSLIIQLISLALSVPFVILSAKLRPLGGNGAGIDANLAILAMGLLLFSMFNAIFFPGFYRSGYKVGSAFWKASVGVFIVVAADVLGPHIIPWLDGYDGRQTVLLAASVLIYCAVSLLACKRSEANFEKVDL